MSVQAFFKRAIHEAQRYGEDSWIFLRELVQNSRDAGASHIYCQLDCREGWTYLDFQDNGEGMDAAHFERYLLRLYASSKEHDHESIGFYGVGFWSSLLFEPRIIRVVSKHAKETIGYEIDVEAMSVKPFEAALPHTGTRITLIRPQVYRETTLRNQIKEKLIYYAGPVRPAGGRESLEISCNGEVINQKFELPAYFPRNLNAKDFDGVMGLGNHPFVKLYKGGILVRDLSSLEELLPNRASRLPPTGLGLYPQIKINADGLKVLMDRQSVFEDPVLLNVVETCEDQLLSIQQQMVQQIFPMNWPNRLWHSVQGIRKKALFWVSVFACMLFLITGLFWIGKSKTIPSLAQTTRPQLFAKGYIDAAFDKWRGPAIDQVGQAPPIQWQFSFEGGPPYLLFGLKSLTKYHPKRGWLASTPDNAGPYPNLDYEAAQTLITVNLATKTQGKPVMLPVPSKYRLIRDSIATNTGKKPRVLQTKLGEPFVVLSQPEKLRYQVVQAGQQAPLNYHRALTIDAYPEEEAAFLNSLTETSAKQKAKAIATYLTQHFHYSRSAQASQQFEQAKGSFIERVKAAGGGDCDLLNGMYALMLQTAGVPAYLNVGLVGRNGRAESSMHAWVRYWAEGEWVTADIIAPQHFHPQRPNQVVPSGPPANLDQTARARGSSDNNPANTSSVIPAPTLQQMALETSQQDAAKAKPFPWIIFIAVGLLALIALVWWMVKKSTQKVPPKLDQPAYMANLFENYLKHGTGNDPLQLKFRPLFSTLEGKNLSLFQIHRIQKERPLLGAKRDCGLLAAVPSSTPVLDRDQPLCQSLFPFLPSIIWLDELAPVFANPNLPQGLRELEAVLREYDPNVRLYLRPRSSSWREVFLPFKDKQMGKRHIFIGKNHPKLTALCDFSTHASHLQQFQILRMVLEKSTFFMNTSEKILMERAMEVVPPISA